MILIEKLFRSSIGKKILVAVSGLGMGLFLLAHMSGNLLMFAGPDAINEYAAGMRRLFSFGEFPLALWGARFGLLAFFLMHVSLTLVLAYENKKARPVSYQYQGSVQLTFASRTMIITGALVLFFIIYHLLHFTMGDVHSQYFNIRDHLGRHNVYEMLIRNFRHKTEFLGVRWPFITLSYLGALGILGLHLHHGIASLFQTLSAVRSQTNYAFFRKLSAGIVLIIIGGFSSVPLAILVGILKLAGEK